MDAGWIFDQFTVDAAPAPAQGRETLPEDDALIIRLPSILDPLDLGPLFPRLQPLEVELGSGDGGFILQLARLRPERNFLAIERLLGRLRKIDRRGRRERLSNLRCLRIEAGYFLQYLLPAHSAETIHIYFPDPWPKRRHRRFRLIHEPFASVAAQALRPGGLVCLRTDDADYFAQMQRVFRSNAQFEEVPTPPDLAALRTDFEREFLARGIPALKAAYRLTRESCAQEACASTASKT
jgi:tRNA (guanine-N7-)-methyltransferase